METRGQKRKQQEVEETVDDYHGFEREVRVYLDGVFDLFHYGHARALQQAKELFPNTYLLVGVVNDEVTTKHKGKAVLSHEERVESVSHCRYVDEVIPNAPWTVDAAFLAQHKIEFIVHGFKSSKEVEEDELYKFPKHLGLLKPIKRTEGISASLIILRIVKGYDEYVKRYLRLGLSPKEMNVPFFRSQRLKAAVEFEQTKKRWSKLWRQQYKRLWSQPKRHWRRPLKM